MQQAQRQVADFRIPNGLHAAIRRHRVAGGRLAQAGVERIEIRAMRYGPTPDEERNRIAVGPSGRLSLVCRDRPSG